MDPVALIAAALEAGAASAVHDDAKGAVNAGSDPDLVAAAQELMKLLDVPGTQAGEV